MLRHQHLFAAGGEDLERVEPPWGTASCPLQTQWYLDKVRECWVCR